MVLLRTSRSSDHLALPRQGENNATQREGGAEMDTERLVETHIRAIESIEYSIVVIRISQVYTSSEKVDKISDLLAGIDRHKGYLKEHLEILDTRSPWWGRANHLVRQDDPEEELPNLPKRSISKDQMHLSQFAPEVLFLEEFSDL